jgi:peroxiredoxin
MRITAAALLIALVVPALAIPPVPRPSKEFTFVEPSGRQTLLTNYKGKVVIIQFLFTWCQHCQAFSRVLTGLQRELAPKGVQMLGVAFDDNVSGPVAAMYQQKYGVGFPVSFASRDTVLSYLGLSVMERLAVPQVVIVDKSGVIRAQSQPMGSPELQSEANLRKLLTELAAQGSAPKTLAPKAPGK